MSHVRFQWSDPRRSDENLTVFYLPRFQRDLQILKIMPLLSTDIFALENIGVFFVFIKNVVHILI